MLAASEALRICPSPFGRGKGEGNKGARIIALTSVLSQRERKQIHTARCDAYCYLFLLLAALSSRSNVMSSHAAGSP
jgi:hypothetical protein